MKLCLKFNWKQVALQRCGQAAVFELGVAAFPGAVAVPFPSAGSPQGWGCCSSSCPQAVSCPGSRELPRKHPAGCQRGLG